MTYLLLQTFLLLLASYFLGAFLACTAKRAILGSRASEPAYAGVREPHDEPLHPPATSVPWPVSPRPVAPPVVPRPIDPVQPRIDVIQRPEPRQLPKLVDPARFERALMGPDLNEGMPRRAIPEIRPVVLPPVTGDYMPGSYGPPPEPEPEFLPEPPPEIVFEPDPVAFEPAPIADDIEAAVTPEVEPPREPVEIEPQRPTRLTRLSDATTSAAAAAVAAAKAAAAASIVSLGRRSRPEPVKHEEAQSEASSLESPQPEPPAGHPEALRGPVEEPAGEHADEIVEASYEDVPADETAEDDIAAPLAHIEDEPEDEDQPQLEDEPAPPFPSVPIIVPQPLARTLIEGGDDFQRIRAIDADIEQRLKAEGIDSFEHIAAWTAADVKRVSQVLGIPGRIDREQWVEQAQILAKGGETYYSRNRVAAQKAATPVEKPASIQLAELTGQDEVERSVEAEPEETKEVAQSEPETESEPKTKTASASAMPREAVPADAASSAPEAVAPAPPQPQPQVSGVAAATQGRSVAEMAAAAAAAIAAASASVTRGLKPIEPISPLSKVDPKISIPAKLSDAIKEKEAAAAQAPASAEAQPPRPMSASSQGPNNDLKRIRGIGVLIEKRLNAMGISRYEQIANWTSGEIDRVSQVLEFKGRIEREGWVEQARILLNGGQTEFSRRVDRGEVDTSRET